MTAPCEHENADHLMPGQSFANPRDTYFASYIVLVEQVRCLDCGAWLSLGPANDGGKHAQQVAVELRAAALAVHLVEHGNFVGCASAEEMNGWFEHYLDRDTRYRVNADEKRRKAQAGYLTRAIVNHDDEQAPHHLARGAA
jgi:hypothetical protein